MSDIETTERIAKLEACLHQVIDPMRRAYWHRGLTKEERLISYIYQLLKMTEPAVLKCVNCEHMRHTGTKKMWCDIAQRLCFQERDTGSCGPYGANYKAKVNPDGLNNPKNFAHNLNVASPARPSATAAFQPKDATS